MTGPEDLEQGPVDVVGRPALLPSDVEIVSASGVGDRPRWWCESLSAAKALASGAGSLLTLADLHTEPGKPGDRWAIVQRQAPPAEPAGAGWIVVDFKPGLTHVGGRVAYGPWASAELRDRAVASWVDDKRVHAVEVLAERPADVQHTIPVVRR